MSDCKFKETDRTGLYIMVFIILCNVYGCNNNGIERDIKHIKEAVDSIVAEGEEVEE